jgi:F0F1-type ATP synthase membrane subunit c/vacuolar-type H+-ATPase subunit K
VTDFVVDGNAMAGDLREIFAADVTAAVVTCAGCGRGSAIGELLVWGRAPGGVARCPECEDVIMRVVRAPDRIFLDLRGALRLELPLSA